MIASRDRKEAAKRLGIALGADYRRLLEATGDEEISAAAVKLGQTFNDNVSFICWVLREYGGMQQMPFERARKPAPLIGFNGAH